MKSAQAKTWTVVDVLAAILVYSKLNRFVTLLTDLEIFVEWARNRRKTQKLLEDFNCEPSRMSYLLGETIGSLQNGLLCRDRETLRILAQEKKNFLKKISDLFSEEEIKILKRLGDDFKDYNQLIVLQTKFWII